MKVKPVTRTDPVLWEECKKEAVQKAGKFSARAMQQAVGLYKKRGGGYIGEKSAAIPLARWQKAQSPGEEC